MPNLLHRILDSHALRAFDSLSFPSLAASAEFS
jgi:hypothetical protein